MGETDEKGGSPRADGAKGAHEQHEQAHEHAREQQGQDLQEQEQTTEQQATEQQATEQQAQDKSAKPEPGEPERAVAASGEPGQSAEPGQPAERREERPGEAKEWPAGDAAKGVKTRSADEEAYDRVKRALRELVAKKRRIDRDLEELEERLYVEEGTYLQDASAGNVAKGFEHYTKGSQNRRKSLLGEQDRVFSQSSTSFEAES